MIREVLFIGWDAGSRDRQNALIVLAVICTVLLATTVLALTGPSDSQVEGNQRTVEASR